MSKSESPVSMNEHLSALLDDEAGSFEQRRVLDEIKIDEALSKKLGSYALIGETMRAGETQPNSIVLGSSFLESIHDKIDQEDQFDQIMIADNHVQSSADQSNKESNASKSFLRPIGGFAIAASVGALAFMGLQNMGILNTPATQQNNVVDSSGPTAIVDVSPVKNESTNNVSASEPIITVSNDQYIDADAQTRSMLKRYLDSHIQHASASSFVPSVRVIAYTDNQ